MTKASAHINRKSLEFANKIADAIYDKGMDLLVMVSPVNPHTGGQGNIWITDAEGNPKVELRLDINKGAGSTYTLNILRDNVQLGFGLVEPSDFYSQACDTLEMIKLNAW